MINTTNWNGSNMRCTKCNHYLPDRCICDGPSIEQQRITKAFVYEALGNAKENGYDELFDMTSAEIAHDIKEYDAELELTKTEHLIPHIEEWLKEFHK
ncbi:hypothetical protein [Acinetobacter sp.]|uniref:hypothetical protein n=1 Tax=Acinetobacter sp. TaxID=472 RepID=UPI00388CF960